jgi:hypothetical protein
MVFVCCCNRALAEQYPVVSAATLAWARSQVTRQSIYTWNSVALLLTVHVMHALLSSRSQVEHSIRLSSIYCQRYMCSYTWEYCACVVNVVEYHSCSCKRATHHCCCCTLSCSLIMMQIANTLLTKTPLYLTMAPLFLQLCKLAIDSHPLQRPTAFELLKGMLKVARDDKGGVEAAVTIKKVSKLTYCRCSYLCYECSV